SVGRLMLGPYDKREPGLGETFSGVVVNPMNQASASKVVEIGAADFSWNDEAFDPQRAWREAARYLAGDRFAGQPGLEADPAVEHTSELQSRENLVCRLLLEKKNTNKRIKKEQY